MSTLSQRASANIRPAHDRENYQLVRRQGDGKPRHKRTGEPKSCPECGCLLDEPPEGAGESFIRNWQHHKLFFKETSLICKNWPINHPEFDPLGSDDAMRGWLLIQAGHCEILDVKLTLEDATNPAKQAAFMTAGFVALQRIHRFGIVAERVGFYCWLVARSIAWSQCGEQEFRTLHQRVHDVYEREGFDIAALLKQALLETRIIKS
jgi:hypothetical protein